MYDRFWNTEAAKPSGDRLKQFLKIRHRVLSFQISALASRIVKNLYVSQLKQATLILSMINTLTSEQARLIPTYRDKWKAIAFSTERIDRQHATEVIKATYQLLKKDEPKVIFFDSPYAAVASAIPGYQLVESLTNQLKREKLKIYSQIETQLSLTFKRQILWKLKDKLWSTFLTHSSMHLYPGGLRQYSPRSAWTSTPIPTHFCRSEDIIQLEAWSIDGSLLYFCVSVLGCRCDRESWQIFEALVSSCGWIIPYEGVCIVCDRPTQIHLDRDGQLHAEGEPAIQYADGFGIHIYHGRIEHYCVPCKPKH